MVHSSAHRPLRLTVLGVLGVLSAALPALAANTGKQTPPIKLGTSGGSASDISTQFCCGGTLGSLVTRDGVQYILSNNHVLARSGLAVTGENIIQPGLVDSACSASGDNVVATFPGNIVPLGTGNVDTALGKVIAGKVDSTGSILGVGVPCSSTASPTVGLKVEKAGRTTGLTTGTIQAINVTVTIQYQRGCGVGSTFNETYTNQVSITPGTFSAGGDSGSLIVSNANSSHHPVALLYAGSSSATIGNRISAVVSAYQAGGHSFGFVGKTCTSLRDEELLVGPSAFEVERATSIKEDHEAELFARPGVLGVGVGRVSDDPEETEAAIVIYVRSDGRSLARNLNLPEEMDGVKVRVIPTDPFVSR
ncbi:MAG TPA: hypothetical protein VIH93_09970 [Thermoanaerobaculia bacterium]